MTLLIEIWHYLIVHVWFYYFLCLFLYKFCSILSPLITALTVPPVFTHLVTETTCIDISHWILKTVLTKAVPNRFWWTDFCRFSSIIGKNRFGERSVPIHPLPITSSIKKTAQNRFPLPNFHIWIHHFNRFSKSYSIKLYSRQYSESLWNYNGKTVWE